MSDSAIMMLVLLWFVFCFAVGGWLGVKVYRPWLQKRARKQRKAELELAAMRYESDQELIDEVLRERGMR